MITRFVRRVFLQRNSGRQRCIPPGPNASGYSSHCHTIIRNHDIVELTAQIVEQVRRLDLPLHGLWAVRSSATNEDGAHASFAGVYRTRLGIPLEEIGSAVKDLWLSIWDERVLNYHATSGLSGAPPAMAVVIQPLLEAQAAGVAYSVHPLTGQGDPGDDQCGCGACGSPCRWARDAGPVCG